MYTRFTSYRMFVFFTEGRSVIVCSLAMFHNVVFIFVLKQCLFISVRPGPLVRPYRLSYGREFNVHREWGGLLYSEFFF